MFSKMGSVSCECNQLPRILNNEKYSNHLKDGVEVLDRKDDGWGELGKCHVCAQHWQLDKWDKLRIICASKLIFLMIGKVTMTSRTDLNF
jgi:hypothetical protein